MGEGGAGMGKNERKRFEQVGTRTQGVFKGVGMVERRVAGQREITD